MLSYTVKNNHGMSLMETLSAAMIFVVIFMLTYGTFDSGSRLMSVTDASANNQINVRQALMDMERAIRGATDVKTKYSEANPEKSDVRFTLNGVNYRYYIQKATPQDSLYQLLEKISPGNDKIIANNIVSCTFRLVEPPLVVEPLDREKWKVLITVTAQKTTYTNEQIDFTLSQWVALRNADGSQCSEGQTLVGEPPGS